jgi:hypothetical protein
MILTDFIIGKYFKTFVLGTQCFILGVLNMKINKHLKYFVHRNTCIFYDTLHALTEVWTKICVLWDMTPCILL